MVEGERCCVVSVGREVLKAGEVAAIEWWQRSR